MRILDFLFQVVEQFSPMNDSDRAELRTDANIDYLKIKQPLLDAAGLVKKKEDLPQKLTVKQKIVIAGEKWEIRLGLAMLFIVITPMIRNWMNPQIELVDEGEDEQD